MAKDKIIAPEAVTSGKITRQEIEKRLTTVFADLQREIGDKKFKQRVKKASKLLSHGAKKKEKDEDKTAKVKSVEVKKTLSPKKVVVAKKLVPKKIVSKKTIAARKVAKGK